MRPQHIKINRVPFCLSGLLDPHLGDQCTYPSQSTALAMRDRLTRRLEGRARVTACAGPCPTQPKKGRPS